MTNSPVMFCSGSSKIRTWGAYAWENCLSNFLLSFTSMIVVCLCCRLKVTMAYNMAACQAGHKHSPVLMDCFHGIDCPFNILCHSFWSAGNIINQVKHPVVGVRHLHLLCKGEEPGYRGSRVQRLPRTWRRDADSIHGRPYQGYCPMSSALLNCKRANCWTSRTLYLDWAWTWLSKNECLLQLCKKPIIFMIGYLVKISRFDDNVHHNIFNAHDPCKGGRTLNDCQPDLLFPLVLFKSRIFSLKRLSPSNKYLLTWRHPLSHRFTLCVGNHSR